MSEADTDTSKPRRNYPKNRKPRADQAEHIRRMTETRIRNARERKIAELLASAPPLTSQQVARLSVLLNSHPVVPTDAKGDD